MLHGMKGWKVHITNICNPSIWKAEAGEWLGVYKGSLSPALIRFSKILVYPSQCQDHSMASWANACLAAGRTGFSFAYTFPSEVLQGPPQTLNQFFLHI